MCVEPPQTQMNTRFPERDSQLPFGPLAAASHDLLLHRLFRAPHPSKHYQPRPFPFPALPLPQPEPRELNTTPLLMLHIVSSDLQISFPEDGWSHLTGATQYLRAHRTPLPPLSI